MTTANKVWFVVATSIWMGTGCYERRAGLPDGAPGPNGGWGDDSGWGGDGGWPNRPTPASDMEVCNGFDDNEDGQVDEHCVCNPGETQVCYPLPSYFLGPDVLRRGICRKGTQVCTGPIEFGFWGECKNAVMPELEVCGDGVDQDCDGFDMPCPGGGPRPPDGGGPPPVEQPDAEPPPPTEENCDEFTFGRVIAPVDIVCVVDQSGSMGNEIRMVRDNMNDFAGSISSASVDYRVILVATRSNDPDGHEICIRQPLAGPGCSDSSRFRQIDRHVDSHNALPLYRANAHRIEAFMRPNSARHIIVVSDDECEPFFMCGAGFDLFLSGRDGYEGYTFHSIVGQPSSRCDPDGVGSSYSGLSRRTNGVNFDICNSDWSSLYSQLERSVTRATTKFTLSERPVRGTVEVTFNGAPAAEGSRWRYEERPNQILLGGSLPANGTRISVCYEHY